MKLLVLLAFALAFVGLQNQVVAKSTGRHQNPLIVGGQPARQGQFPYQLAVLYRNSPICGASLVEVAGVQVALSAAHCLYSGDEYYTQLVAGELDTEVDSGLEQTRQLVKIQKHPDYGTSGESWNDIAILFFNASFSLNENVQWIPLPQQGQNTTGNVTVSGWGRLSNWGPSPNFLHYVETPVVGNERCQQAWDNNVGLKPKINASQLCAGESTGTISSCQGDSGGPARSEEGYLAGIVSFSKDCGHPDIPEVFTRVSHFVDWIHETVASYTNQTLL